MLVSSCIKIPRKSGGLRGIFSNGKEELPLSFAETGNADAAQKNQRADADADPLGRTEPFAASPEVFAFCSGCLSGSHAGNICCVAAHIG